MSEADRILLRTVEDESYLLLSGYELREGQTLEQEDESPQEDIPAFEKPEGVKKMTHKVHYGEEVVEFGFSAPIQDTDL